LKQSRYAPRDLWRAAQFGGQWEDKYGNRLTLARVLYPFPANWPSPHVPRETYDEVIRSVTNGTSETLAEDALADWVKDFAGAQSVTGHAVKRRPFSLGELIEYDVEADTKGWMAGYCFRFRTDRSGRRYFALLHLHPDLKSDRARKAIHGDFLPSLKQPRFTRTKRTNRGAQYQDAALLKRVGRGKEFLRSLERARKSIAATTGWWTVETPNYILASNLGAGKGTFVKQIQTDIELLRAAYEVFMPPRKPVSAISVVRIFASEREYVSYVGAGHAWSCGLWVPARRELIIKPLEWNSKREAREQTLRTVYHEAFHQYLHYAYDELETAAWFNEGHACFFEGAEIKRGRVCIEEYPMRLKCLAALVKSGGLDISKLLQLSYGEFYASDEQVMMGNYATAWGLIYFLRKYASLDSDSDYGRILQRYADELWSSRNSRKATEAAFEGIDIGTFQKDFVEFWHTKKARTAAERNDIFAGTKP